MSALSALVSCGALAARRPVPQRTAAARSTQALAPRAAGTVKAASLRAATVRPRARLARRAACASAGFAAASASAPKGVLADIAAGAKARLEADPSFLFKLGIEVGMDEVITCGVNVAARGSPFLWSPETALQVLAQCFVSAFNDVALVWCLAPAAAGAGASAQDAALNMAHVFEPGPFTVAQRAATWARKWRLYSVIGLATGLLSLALTGVLSRQAALLAPAALGRAALTGALHLGISANTRYQIVNGIEVLLYAAMPESAARVASVALRFANNCAGSLSWILLSGALAKLLPA